MNNKGKGLPGLRRYRFHFTAERPVLLPAYPGSMWRGLLGHGLRRAACVTRQPECAGCLLMDECVYNRVFESRGPETAAARHLMRPHPFMLDVSPAGPASTTDLMFGITLMQQAETALPYIVHAMDSAGRLGIGREKTPFRLTRVAREPGLGDGRWETAWLPGQVGLNRADAAMPGVPEPPGAVAITLETPLRIKRHGRLLGPGEFCSDYFLRQLWRRVTDIQSFYGGDLQLPLPPDAPDGIAEREKRLRWQDWRRYSSRQKTAMNMGGLTGSWIIDDPRLAQWWPLIWYGQWLHLGKATSMGLGRYRVVPL